MDGKALEEKFEEFARWYALPLDKSEDGIYRALETQSAWMSFQHQQAKVEELQKQFDQHDKLLLQRNKDVQELYDINVKHAAEKAELKASHHGEVIGHEVHFKKIKQERDELEKRLNSIPFEKIKEAIEGNAMLLYNEFSEDDAYEKARKLIGILEQALKGVHSD
ncbi:hypothetical protein OHX02_12390 [Acinetobacter baumannii]|nr:hypothetical protein [Acinetobacter baumannii]